MSADLLVIIASIIIAWLIFTWLIKVIKASVTTAIAITAIVLVLQLVFGIGYQEVGQQILRLPQIIWQFFSQQ